LRQLLPALQQQQSAEQTQDFTVMASDKHFERELKQTINTVEKQCSKVSQTFDALKV
jgi:hypothetical protein